MSGKARTYGLPYRGSKSRIAGWVLDHLPGGPALVDLFAGGCAVTHAALLSGRWRRVIANDLGDGPAVFEAARAGEFDGYITLPMTREAFKRSEDEAVRLLWSFSNNGEQFLWGHDTEEVQEQATAMLTEPTVYGRRIAYRRFCVLLARYLGEGGSAMKLSHKDDLCRQERLQAISGCPGDLIVYRLDYRDCPVPDGAVVYADPPYRHSTVGGGRPDMRGYAGQDFDFDAFDAWLAEVPHMVVVSEVTCPAGCVSVAERPLNYTMSATNNAYAVTEHLFVQERFADEYRERMAGEDGGAVA